MAAVIREPFGRDPVVWLRDMILKDAVALEKWSLVLVRVVTRPDDQVALNSQLQQPNQSKYADAVLTSLRLWQSSGEERADLLRVFRDYGLKDLADKCTGVIQLLDPLKIAPSAENTPPPTRDVNGKPLTLYTDTPYAITSKATGFAYDHTEPLDMWKHAHWFEIRDEEGASNVYTLENRNDPDSVWMYETVQFSQVTGSSACFFIHPVPQGRDEEREAGLLYKSSRNDHLLKGNFVGFYEKSDGCGYDWDAFEFRFTPFVEHVKRTYNITAKMTDFRFQSSPESFVTAHRKGAGLIEEHSIVNNVHGLLFHGNRGAGLFQTVTHAHRNESATIHASESISASVSHFDSFSVNFAFNPADVIPAECTSPVFEFSADWSSPLPAEVRRWTSGAGRPHLPTDWVENLEVGYDATVAVRISDKFGNATALPEEKCDFILEKLGFKEPLAEVGAGGVLKYTTRGQMITSFPFTDLSSVQPELASA